MAAASVLVQLLSACLVFLHADGQKCREGWYYHGGSCYSFGESNVTWGDAEGICKTFRSKLAEIETSEENEFIRNLTMSKSAMFTSLGGTDMFDEGVWVWASSGNNIYPFVDWAPGQPDDYGTGEDCLLIDSGQGYHWDDVECTHLANFICEIKATEDTVVG